MNIIRSLPLGVAALTLGAMHLHAQPIVVVDRDDVSITQSCIVRIPAGLIIPDPDNDGVIHINASGIEVTFEPGSELRGKSLYDTACDGWDSLTGKGIRIHNRSNVTLRNARVHGYKVGLHASEADGLDIDGGDFSDNYRKKLGSTPQSEDGSDWMSPHENDGDQWISTYGGSIYVTRSDNIRVADVYIRRSQNGILLDEVNNSDIYDNDASFLSGWGLGMYRSSFNTVTRNAFDFCIRGHSEGVYNRGQDSAGILMFEQCSNNLIAENSATHGGDGIFGFAGLDALDANYNRAGCNDNLFVKNDLSYAAAHGLEMTFSFGNKIFENRFHENAICGIWGGFSQDTLISDNDFDGNGGMPYGEERGAINIEHGKNNTVVRNTFTNNMKGVFFWWDSVGSFANYQWYQRNYSLLSGNTIFANTFLINDDPRPFPGREFFRRDGIHLRNDSASTKFTDLSISNNDWFLDGSLPRQYRIEGNVTYDSGGTSLVGTPGYLAKGDNTPVGERDHLRGRHNILMGEWGPWEHEGLFVREYSVSGNTRTYEVFGASPDATATLQSGSATVSFAPWAGATPPKHRLAISTSGSEANYTVLVADGPHRAMLADSAVTTQWTGRVWSWAGGPDPRDNFSGWYALRNGPSSAAFSKPALDFFYAWGGPPDFGMGSSALIGTDYFGFEGTANVPLSPGEWKITTNSDDGIRVTVDGQSVIENFTWHAPTVDTGTFSLAQAKTVTIHVLHFEIDGYAVLELDIERVSGSDCGVCRTDINLDGRVDFMDIPAFLDATDRQRDDADFVPDGNHNANDVNSFVLTITAGEC